MNLDTLQNLTMDDINRMSTSELQSALQYGKKVLVTRYKTQKTKIGSVAPVFQGKGSPYRLRTTNLTRNQMVSRLVSTVQKTKAPTTTVTGYKKWRKKQEKVFAPKTEQGAKTELTEKDYKKIWDAYDRLKQIHPALTQIIDYKKIIKTISQYVMEHKRIEFKNIDKVVQNLAMQDSDTSRYYAEEEWNNLL